MRIVYLALLLIVLLNIGNPCDLGLRATPDTPIAPAQSR